MRIKTQNEKDERVSDTPEKRLTKLVRVQVIFASIQSAILLATCMVAGSIGLQQHNIHQQLLNASRDTVTRHREVLERTEVATIVLDTVHCSKTPLTLATEVHSVFRNSGRTVVKDVTLTWYLTIRGVPLGPKPLEPLPSKMFIPIRGNIVGDVLAVSTALNKDSLALVNAGKMHLTVLGTLEFYGVFDHKHEDHPPHDPLTAGHIGVYLDCASNEKSRSCIQSIESFSPFSFLNGRRKR